MTRSDWPQLIAAHNHAVVVSLLAKGLRLSAARELAAETWARLYERWQLDALPVVELPGLAIRQAHFLSLDAFRRPTHAALDEALAVPDGAASPEHQVLAKEQLALVSAAFNGLSPRAREVFAAVLAQPEHSHAELAKRLGVSLQRLRQTLCEVRARLRSSVVSS